MSKIGACEHCGILYDKEIVCKNRSEMEEHLFVGRCPVCDAPAERREPICYWEKRS